MTANQHRAVLAWPYEGASEPPQAACFANASSNLCLDFHGDPCAAELTVFSDGNHHMALAEALARFRTSHPDLGEIFYATTPPRVIVEALRRGRVLMGNLALSCRPDVFISPPEVLDGLCREGFMQSHVAFASNLGCALLVAKGNPCAICSMADLLRPDVRVFLSNPVTEKASHDVYVRTLLQTGGQLGLSLDGLFGGEAGAERLVLGECIHHREAPQFVADGRADVAVVFWHLALRYVRIFPDRFEMMPLVAGARAAASNPTHVGLIGSGGRWGARLVGFLLSPEVAAIYGRHGLAHAG